MNIWGWLVVLGAVGASVGFMLYGMGTSTLLPDEPAHQYWQISADRRPRRARGRVCRL